MKPILYLFSLAIISISCFSGCNKGDSDGPTTADGHIIDATTGNGIGGAKAIIVRRKKASMTALDATQIASQVTDANGHFHFEFDGEESYGYTVVGSAGHYSDQSEGGYVRPGRKNKDLKVSLSPRAYLFIKLINKPPIDKKDVFVSGYFNPTISLPNYGGDTAFYRAPRGNKENIVSLVTTTAAGQEIKHYNIYCPALDTTEITLEY
jgi:hypothetical protein